MAERMGHLAHDEITALHAAAVAARLAERRLAVFAGVDPGIVALLPTAAVPVDQLLLDLHGLNTIVLPGGREPPLALWLKNALTLAPTPHKAAIAAAVAKAVDALGLRALVDAPSPAREGPAPMGAPGAAARPREASLACYVSYASRDAELGAELCTALAPWVRARGTRVWHRGLLSPGPHLAQADEELASAEVIVLLLSASHAEEEVTAAEAERALARHMRGEAWIIPVVARPFFWRGTPIRELAVLPSDGRALTSWQNRDEAWLDVVNGIDAAVQALKARVPPPPRAERSRPENMGEQLASDAGARRPAPKGAPPRGEQTSFEWEAWLFDRCAKSDHASLSLLAADLQDVNLAARVRELACHVEAGKWPPGMAPTLLRLEQTKAGWHADVRIGFLGQVCAVALRPGARVPLGVGASLEAEEQDGEVLVRLVAGAESALRGTQARIRAGARMFTKWLVPPGTGALGSEPDEMTLFELALPNERSSEEEGS
jgi:hypothetical protein